jgi:hypothetical protein
MPPELVNNCLHDSGSGTDLGERSRRVTMLFDERVVTNPDCRIQPLTS